VCSIHKSCFRFYIALRLNRRKPRIPHTLAFTRQRTEHVSLISVLKFQPNKNVNIALGVIQDHVKFTMEELAMFGFGLAQALSWMGVGMFC